MEPIHRGQQRTKLGEEDVHRFLRGSHFFADLPTYSVKSRFIFFPGGYEFKALEQSVMLEEQSPYFGKVALIPMLTVARAKDCKMWNSLSKMQSFL